MLKKIVSKTHKIVSNKLKQRKVNALQADILLWQGNDIYNNLHVFLIFTVLY